MILKASQRAYASELAAHLLHANDNEHVEVHKISGFVANSVEGAFQEAQALSYGTRCQQFLFSVSLNPPQDEDVPISVFEDAISRIEKKLGMEGQPHVMVFHEKHGRRHAHCVWSRIDTQEMKAINLPYFKNKLMEISKEMYLEQKWKLPAGFVNQEARNPLNFTQEQWQQAKRLDSKPKNIKLALHECWAVSDSKQAFSSSLEQHGFYLAKGDRRGFVAVDWRGEVYSLSRWLDVKTKTLRERLGQTEILPSVTEIKANIDHDLVKNICAIMERHTKKFNHSITPLLAHKKRMNERHIKARETLERQQEKKLLQEYKERQFRFRDGLQGLWDRLTGSHQKMIKQNETEASQANIRDRIEKDTLIHSQLKEYRIQQQKLEKLHTEQQEHTNKIKEAIFSNLPDEKVSDLEREFYHPPLPRECGFDFER